MATINGPNRLIRGVIGYDSSPEPIDQVAPHNLHAERQVISACALDSGVCESILDRLEPEHFFREAHSVIFRAIRDVFNRGEPVDGVTITDELEKRGQYKRIGGDEAVAEVLASAPHAANALYHADIVRQRAMQRAYIESRNEELKASFTNLYTPSELLKLASKNLASIEAIVEEDDFDESLIHPWPDQPDPAVWHGVAGRLIKAIEPHSEADPMAILGQFLVCVGNLVGRKPHWFYESTRHGLNLYLCVVGESSKARKGTSWEHVIRILRRVDENWSSTRILAGLSTGEGLIHQVRDPLTKQVRVDGDYEDREIDAGVQDKRVLFVESEFGGLLTTMSRDGYNTSAVIRQAWESGNLAIANKNTPSRATNAHVSIIGHITSAELHGRLTNSDAANGFANRFLWVCSRRSKYLPHGGQIHTVDLMPLILELQDVVNFVNYPLDESVPLIRDPHANQLWEHVYPQLTEAKPGLLGSIVSRSEAQVMRLAAIYAILDQSTRIREDHLLAALAFWRYSEQSAAWIFGENMGDPEAEAVLKALKAAGPEGLTRTQINRRAFSGHKRADDLDKVLSKLLHSSLISPPPKGEKLNARNRQRRWTLKQENVQEAARFARSAPGDDATSTDDGACDSD